MDYLPPEPSVVLVTGLPRTGKSLISARLLRTFVKRGWEVHSNMRVKFDGVIPCYGLEVLKQAPAGAANRLIVLDEAHTVFSARQWNDESLQMLSQLGKSNTWCVAISQNAGQLAKPFRSMAVVMIKCSMLGWSVWESILCCLWPWARVVRHYEMIEGRPASKPYQRAVVWPNQFDKYNYDTLDTFSDVSRAVSPPKKNFFVVWLAWSLFLGSGAAYFMRPAAASKSKEVAPVPAAPVFVGKAEYRPQPATFAWAETYPIFIRHGDGAVVYVHGVNMDNVGPGDQLDIGVFRTYPVPESIAAAVRAEYTIPAPDRAPLAGGRSQESLL